MTEGNGDVRELPKGWISANIGSLGEVITGSTPPKKDPSFFGGTIPFYKPTDLDAGYEVVEAREYLSDLGASQSRTIPAFSILVTCIGATIGKTGLARRKCATNQQINAVVLPLSCINPKWFFWMVSSAKGQQMIIDNSSATTMPIINKSRFSELVFPIPPFQEQNRIVEKIEELFSELDQGIESLQTAQRQLKVYRQAVLKWAFEGKLTEEWRKQHSSTLKTGEALLVQIKAEREIRYQQQLAEWEEKVREWEAIGKVGKKPTKPAKLKDVSLLTEAELSELPKLPHSWYWLRFGELVSSIRGGTTAVPIDTSTDYPILRSSSVRAGTIDYSDVRFLTSEQASDIKDFVEVDDLLFTRLNGTVDYVGNCSRVTEYHPNKLIYPDRLYCAKLLLTNMAKYVEKAFENPILRRIIENKAKSTAGHKRISIPDVLDMPFPLPNAEEMDAILLDLETRLSICDRLEDTIIENLQKAEALRQSILKQAFEGKLVPQDPNDEPAEKLLERIKAERQENQTSKTSNQLKIKGL